MNNQLYKIKQQLSTAQSQLLKIQQLLNQNIIIDNQTGRNLKLKINVQDHTLGQTIDIQSQITIPNNSKITHSIIHSDQPPQNTINQLDTTLKLPLTIHCKSQQKYNNSNILPNSNLITRQQQIFQLPNKLQPGFQSNRQHCTLNEHKIIINNTPQIFINKKLSYGNQILVQDDLQQSQIQQNIQDLVESKYIKIKNDKKQDQINEQPSSARIDQSYGTGIINLPLSIKKPNNIFSTDHIHPNHKDNTQLLNWNIHDPQSKQKLNLAINNWTIQKLNPSSKIKQSTKRDRMNSYAQKSRQKAQYLKIKGNDRQNRFNNTLQCSKKSRSKSLNNIEIKKQKNIKQINLNLSRKADDLFLARKDQYLKKIDKQKNNLNQIRKQSRQKSLTSIKDNIINIIRYNKQQQKKQILQKTFHIQKINNLTTRLYNSKDKIPCNYYNKYNKQKLKQNYKLYIQENPIIQKYLNIYQQQQLFNILIKQNQPIYVWPIKMVNYTYQKIKKISDLLKNKQINIK